jgi:PII-like signaling protein
MELQNLEMMRIFVGEQVRYGHRPLYEEIVREARLFGLAGATALKGVLSYGHDMQINTSKIMELGTNLPMVIELVDSPEKIDGFIPIIQQLVRDASGRAMVTREQVRMGIIE